MGSPRKPLVLDDNKEIQQLQADDTLDAVVAGGVTTLMLNGVGATVPMGSVVSHHGTDTNKFILAKANSVDSFNKARAIGFAVAAIASAATGAIIHSGAFTIPEADWADITLEGTALTPGSAYFLSSASSPVSGMPTKTAPTSGWIVKLGVALTTETLLIDIDPPILL